MPELCYAFSPLPFAQGAPLAGTLADSILFAGEKLTDFKGVLVGIPVLVLVVALGPLLVFVPRLWLAKRRGLIEYGALAERYVRDFDRKWQRGERPANEALLGSADIQSLADLGNSYALVEDMRVIPVSRNVLLQLAVITVVPLAPLLLTLLTLLTLLSPADLLDRLVKMRF